MSSERLCVRGRVEFCIKGNLLDDDDDNGGGGRERVCELVEIGKMKLLDGV